MEELLLVVIRFLAPVLWEALLQTVAEICFEVGLGSLKEPFQPRSRAHPVFASIGLLLLGGLAGGLASWIFQARLMPPAPLPGASIVLSPLLTGWAMAEFGRWRERRGREASFAATFAGGAFFAFGMASVRLLLVRG